MTTLATPESPGRLARRFYRQAKLRTRHVSLRLNSLETLLAVDPGGAGALSPGLALAGANLALFLLGRPASPDLASARAALESGDISALARPALNLIAAAENADTEIAAENAILAARNFLVQARRAQRAILRDKSLPYYARWLTPLADNAAAAALILGLFAVVAAAFWPLLLPATNFEKRLDDLQGIMRLLEHYRCDHGSYPVSPEFSGFKPDAGAGEYGWIPGLVPSYTRLLPRDPRRDNDPAHQYLYNSNGADYKLISHNPEDCRQVKAARPELVDPVRDCRAYGFWTKGARDW